MPISTVALRVSALCRSFESLVSGDSRPAESPDSRSCCLCEGGQSSFGAPARLVTRQVSGTRVCMDRSKVRRPGRQVVGERVAERGFRAGRIRGTRRPVLDEEYLSHGGEGADYSGAAFSSAAATASNSASAAVRSSTISRAMISGAGRLSAFSRESSRSQVMSRLTLSRAMSSS